MSVAEAHLPLGFPQLIYELFVLRLWIRRKLVVVQTTLHESERNFVGRSLYCNVTILRASVYELMNVPSVHRFTYIHTYTHTYILTSIHTYIRTYIQAVHCMPLIDSAIQHLLETVTRNAT